MSIVLIDVDQYSRRIREEMNLLLRFGGTNFPVLAVVATITTSVGAECVAGGAHVEHLILADLRWDPLGWVAVAWKRTC